MCFFCHLMFFPFRTAYPDRCSRSEAYLELFLSALIVLCFRRAEGETNDHTTDQRRISGDLRRLRYDTYILGSCISSSGGFTCINEHFLDCFREIYS